MAYRCGWLRGVTAVVFLATVLTGGGIAGAAGLPGSSRAPGPVGSVGSVRSSGSPGAPRSVVPGGALTPSASRRGPAPDVVGGYAAPPGQFPWMVRLSMGCGGSVLTAWVVLTAAHCVPRTGADTGIVATIGRTRLSAPGGQVIRSSYVLRSPRYARTGTVDWALVELAQPTAAPPLALVGQGDTAARRARLTVMGWGSVEEGGAQSDVLRYATVPFVDDATCARSYRTQFRPATELCAGYPQGGVDTCQGDSGGPMIADVAGRAVQVGIVSYGMGCARPGYPGVYAEVEAFSAEISSHLGSQGRLVAPAG